MTQNSFLKSKFLEKSNVALFAVLCMIIGFFLSRIVLSMAMMLFGINALRDIHARRWLKDKWWLLGVCWVAIYGISWFWSEDKAFWNDRFQVKFAILLLPLAFTFTPAFTTRQARLFTWALGLSLLGGAAYSLSFLLKDPAFYIQGYNVSHILPTIPKDDHIRFSLTIACSIAWMVFIYPFMPDRPTRMFIITASMLLGLYLHILAARTGLTAFYVYVLVWAVYLALRKKTRMIGLGVFLAFILWFVLAFRFIPTFQQRMRYVSYTLSLYRHSDLNSLYGDMSRVISYDVSWRLIRQHPLGGVGAGDIMNEMNGGYDRWYPRVAEPQRLVPHNQFLTVALGCGLPAALVFTVWVFYPLFNLKRSRAGFLLGATWLMVFLSLLIEPMLEVQFGVFVYLFFLLWARHFMVRGIDFADRSAAAN